MRCGNCHARGWGGQRARTALCAVGGGRRTFFDSIDLRSDSTTSPWWETSSTLRGRYFSTQGSAAWRASAAVGADEAAICSRQLFAGPGYLQPVVSE